MTSALRLAWVLLLSPTTIEMPRPSLSPVPVVDITGRLLRADGSAAASQTFLFMIRRGAGWHEHIAILDSDAQGRFLLPAELKVGLRRELRISWVKEGEPEQFFAHVDSGPVPQGGALDVGDVREGDGPLIVEGRVTDPEGQPIPNARVTPYLISESDSTLQPYSALWAVSGPDGQFRLLGRRRERSQALRLGAVVEGWCFRKAVAIPPPDRCVELVLHPAGSLQYRDTWIEHADGQKLQIGMRLEPAGRNQPKKVHDLHRTPPVAGIDEGEIKTLGGLAPGPYTLVYSWLHHELARIEDIVVLPGSVAHDPRLAELDLAAEFALAEIEVVSPEGPVDPAILGIWSTSGSTSSQLRPLDPHQSRYLCVIPRAESRALLINAESHLTIEATVVEDTRLTLRPAPRVRFFLPIADSQLAPGIQLRVALCRRVDESTAREEKEKGFDENGDCVFEVDRLGQYEAVWRVVGTRRINATLSRSVSWRLGEPIPVVIDEVQTIHLFLPPALLEEAHELTKKVRESLDRWADRD